MREAKRVQRGDGSVYFGASRVVGILRGVEIESREMTSLVDLHLELGEVLLQKLESLLDDSALPHLLGGCSGFLKLRSASFEVRRSLGDPCLELG